MGTLLPSNDRKLLLRVEYREGGGQTKCVGEDVWDR